MPITFLLQYTDPYRESVVPAFTIPGAHAPPAELEADHQVNVDGMAGDTTVLFGMFSDLFMETVADLNASRPAANAPTHTSLLQERIDELRQQLQKHSQKHHGSDPIPSETFPVHTAAAVFTATNFDDCIWSYFTIFHPQHPFIHWPTFDVYTVSLPLLLAVAFAGSVHCIPRDAALSTRTFFDLAEDFIFERLRIEAVNKTSQQAGALELAQAAVLIIGLQISFNIEATRRRIRISRHPELVASIRSLGLTSTVKTCELNRDGWKAFIAEESRIRTIHILFLMDYMSTFFFNTLPQMAMSEPKHRLPCPDSLFDASTSDEFAILNSIAPRRSLESLSIKALVELLMGDKWLGAEDPSLISLQPRHLMMGIFALHSVIFTSRAALLLPSSYHLLHRALNRWKQLWDAIHTEQSGTIGFTKYCVEIWCVTSKILDMLQSSEGKGKYLEANPTDSLGELHEFIREFCK
ncbi:hypothetical protein FB567DRAFT_590923 [Paraphoma chrysanthemicola]|uniref:Xylanolytic transcriptional activator regulatory domain-containing protein n=1 Tax=Paraphoma chrysanthemicola TaxID=798071 RepID=A0A8K0RAZ7_9PLEO|nr:hypothetical protein FB567DRAFT_590923 [Paraphoma chrysanthemicola]